MLGLVRSSQKGQNLVEFGLSIAAVAFVALVGFGALGQAQAAYWGGPMASTLNTQPPASTHFMHDVVVAAPNCGFSGSQPFLIPAGTALTCTSQTVQDQDASQPSPPRGSLQLQLIPIAPPGPTIVLGACPLIANGPVGQSWCSTFAWTPPSYLASTGVVYALTFVYFPSDNHLSRASQQVQVKFTQNLHWGPTVCVNDLAGGAATTTVEIGHPLRCGTTLTDWTSGAQQIPPQGTPITWSAVGYTAGTPNFTCVPNSVAPSVLSPPAPPPSTPAILMLAPGTSCQPAATTYTCYTDTNGSCQVVFRHLYDINGGGTGSAPVLQMQSPAYVLGPTNPAPSASSPSLTIAPHAEQHPTGIVVLCDNADINPGHLTVQPRVLGDSDTVFSSSFPNIKFGGTTTKPSGTWGGTSDLDISPAHLATTDSTTMACIAFVYDAINAGANNPAVSGGAANPNKQEAFPPAGIVSFNWYSDGLNASVPSNGTCALTPVTSGTYPLQSATQAPFISQCVAQFTISATKPASGNPQLFLNASYSGEPTTPMHQAALSPSQLGQLGHDNNGNPLPGYRFNVDFAWN